MAEKIKISSVVKFSKLVPTSSENSSHLWAVENELDADEIKSVVTFAASERCWLRPSVLPTFQYGSGVRSWGNPKFATYNENDLGIQERKLVISAEPDCFKSYLEEKSLHDLQVIYEWLVANDCRTRKKEMKVKRDYLDELSIRLEDLAKHVTSIDYVESRCIRLGKVENENKGGIIPRADGKRLIFHPGQILTLSDNKIQYWKIADLRFRDDQEKISPEFFKGTKQSVIERSDSTNHCLLNLRDPKAGEVLQDFVSLQKDGEFAICPLFSQVGRDLLHTEYFREPDKFRVTWPNNRAALAEKFGVPRKKTKFETLELGLLLSDKLEQVQKVVKALSGQKIVLLLEKKDSIGYFHLGEILSASVIEALILHLKLDCIVPSRKNLVFCEVQEKVTEEMLTFIWEKMGEFNLQSLSFLGFQLTE